MDEDMEYEQDKSLEVTGTSGNLPAQVADLEDENDKEEDELNRKSEMPFLDHLEEFRKRMLWCLGTIFVGIIVGFYLNSQYDLLEFLAQPVKPFLPTGKLLIIRPTEGFMIALKISFGFGLLVASPMIMYHIWAFVAPALLSKERKVVLPLFIASIFMFVLGAVMAYYITLPLAMAFFSKFQYASTDFQPTAQYYLDIAIKMIFFTGIVFELPIVIMMLARFGIVSPNFLRSKRRHAIVAIFIVCMAVTPPDPGSMVLVAVPMIFLYELSVWIAIIVTRKREKELEEV
ncbi:MAG: twin-arginine translocase subunit TatC [Gemmatimonadota bacterium]|nr:twin-arginine translocase subunit TatC [Gemmatimonadota bacterium]